MFSGAGHLSKSWMDHDPGEWIMPRADIGAAVRKAFISKE
jgi:hypothetical protein